MSHENEPIRQIATPRAGDTSSLPVAQPFSDPEALLRNPLGIPSRRIHSSVFPPELRRRGQEALTGLCPSA